MKNKKLIIGIAAGAAVLAGAAVIIARRRSRKQFENQVSDAREHFKGKLSELQRKAQKEYKNSASDVQDAVNTAKERAADWVNKAKA